MDVFPSFFSISPSISPVTVLYISFLYSLQNFTNNLYSTEVAFEEGNGGFSHPDSDNFIGSLNGKFLDGELLGTYNGWGSISLV
ncbi:hypothetical protein PBCV1_a258R [Paramecium bursaria Chlorella virus 1]|uniref:Uncharacterized protein n=1 Tax=Paramecium bursaria Chlorella virus 1 TaxID=10506 RepID=Q84575_PBCV1|nr:hypothetical protein PBCV1_a258R [Paramecium bursaria Chlorella virus 1]AAC96626.2 hypothetical protein [Paramecium bursaria Chlorella virus 1]